ncbi:MULTISPECIES: hypothetical protein [unclassified Paraflavitalea]|uniref:hypothetical protein n=1 Tax=unclassified Paraflavitalea TaxID=2798305 RepID=UPI003D32823E
MKILRFVTFLFNRYYKTGGKRNVAYFSALCAVVFLIYLHIFQFLIILDKVSLLPLRNNDPRIVKYLKLFLLSIPVYFLLSYLVKEGDLKALKYDSEKIKKWQIFICIYLFANLLVLFLLAFVFAEVKKDL